MVGMTSIFTAFLHDSISVMTIVAIVFVLLTGKTPHNLKPYTLRLHAKGVVRLNTKDVIIDIAILLPTAIFMINPLSGEGHHHSYFLSISGDRLCNLKLFLTNVMMMAAITSWICLLQAKEASRR